MTGGVGNVAAARGQRILTAANEPGAVPPAPLGVVGVVTILEFCTDSSPGSLGAARRQVRDAVANAGLSVESARNLEVAAGEVLANIYQHAYAGRSGPVSVEVVTAPGTVTVVVRDEGEATTPPAIPRTLPSGSIGGGRGLYLVERLVDDVEIAVSPGGHGLTVRMTAHLQRGAGRATGGGQVIGSRLAPLRTVDDAAGMAEHQTESTADRSGTRKK